MAFGAVKTARSHGLSVPEDLSMVGFDDQTTAAYYNPPLTTIHTPCREIGRRATQHLMELIAGRDSLSQSVVPDEARRTRQHRRTSAQIKARATSRLTRPHRRLSLLKTVSPAEYCRHESMRGTSLTDAERAWPPASQAWAAAILLACANSLAFVDRTVLTLLVEPIKADLHVSDTLVSLLSGFSFAVFYVAVGLPVARLADRGNRRNIIATAVLVWSAMTAACGLAAELHQPARRARRHRSRRGRLVASRAVDARRLLSEGTLACGAGHLLDGHLHRQRRGTRARWRSHGCSDVDGCDASRCAGRSASVADRVLRGWGTRPAARSGAVLRSASRRDMASARWLIRTCRSPKCGKRFCSGAWRICRCWARSRCT